MKILLLFLASAALSMGAAITDTNAIPRTPGTHTGVIGGIPTTRTNIINVVTSYSADNTGVSDATTAIQNAINASAEHDIIYLPAGTYKLTGGIEFSGSAAKNRTIRGDGATTILAGSGTGGSITVGLQPNQSDYSWGSSPLIWPAYASPLTDNTVTAGMTAGSTVLTIADTSVFAAGDLIRVALENQTDNAELTAGAVIVFGNNGAGALRGQVTRIQSKTGTTLTIFPAIHKTPDSNLEARVYRQSLTTEGVGIEDLVVDLTDTSAGIAIKFQSTVNSWLKGVRVASVNNYGIYFQTALNCEIRKCHIDAAKSEGSSNHAGLLMNMGVNCLVEDNIIQDNWPCVEVNESSQGTVFSHNFLKSDFAQSSLICHGSHPNLNLYEGNIIHSVLQDGYFSSASEDTYFRNWLSGTRFGGTDQYNPAFTLARWTRKYAFDGNIIGAPGWFADAYALPYNLGVANGFNGSSTGATQPTAGTFWSDWKMTGTLTTRTSDTAGQLTLSAIGTITTGRYVWFRWADTPGTDLYVEVTAVTGNVITFTRFGGGATVLPASSTAGFVFTDSSGYQELDRDVNLTTDATYPGSTVMRGNYWAWTAGGNAIPAVESLGSDTLPTSYVRGDGASKPDWFGSLAWPAFDPSSPGTLTQTGWVRIPAGYRYVNGNEDYLSGGGTGTLNVGTMNVGTISIAP